MWGDIGSAHLVQLVGVGVGVGVPARVGAGARAGARANPNLEQDVVERRVGVRREQHALTDVCGLGLEVRVRAGVRVRARVRVSSP